MTTLVLAFIGVIYNAWRDRRFEVLKAEYEYSTGAKHLTQKIKEQTDQLKKTEEELSCSQQAHEELNRAHTVTLLAAKEHEVHRRYGDESRRTLRKVRAELAELLQQKGHIEGFREAMETVMSNFSTEPKAEESLSTIFPTDKQEPAQKQAALPFGN